MPTCLSFVITGTCGGISTCEGIRILERYKDTVGVAIDKMVRMCYLSFIYKLTPSLPLVQFWMRGNKVLEARFPTLPTAHTSTIQVENPL